MHSSIYKLHLCNGEEIYISFVAQRAIPVIEKKLVKGELRFYLIPVILIPFSEDEKYWIRFVSPSQGKIICSKGWK